MRNENINITSRGSSTNANMDARFYKKTIFIYQKEMYKIISPTFVELPRKTKKNRRMSLDINFYRNLNSFTNGECKHVYFNQMKPQILEILKDKLHSPITIKFVFYNGKRILSDLSNKCCIVDKFFCDCLVQLWLLTDDNYQNIIKVTYEYGGYEKDKQRVEIFITENNL